MKKNCIYILILAFIVASCKKEPLPDLPEDTGPYYSIKGHIDGDFINLNVGQDGILISQGLEYNNGVPSYFGQIVSPAEDLLIKVEFTRQEMPVGPEGLKAINHGEVDFLVQQAGCLTPTFGGNLTQANFLLVKDESGNFVPVSQIEFEEYGIYNVTMKFTDVGQNSFQFPLKYGYNETTINPKFETAGINDTIYFDAMVPGSSHEWYIDNNLVSTDESFATTLSIGIHKVKHIIRDGQFNEAEHTTLIRVTDYVFDWQMMFNNCTGGVNTASNYGKVTVTVLTNGQVYKSDRSATNLSNAFQVSNIKYIGNSSLEPEMAVFDLNFDATLVNESGTDSLSLSGMSGTFNVGLQ